MIDRTGCYGLGIRQRLLLCLMNAVCAALLMAGLTRAPGMSWLSGMLGIGFLVLAVNWLFRYQSRRLPQAATWLPLISLPVTLVQALSTQEWSAVLACILMPVMFLVAGWASLVRQQPVKGIQWPDASLLLAMKVAFDEAMLGYFVSTVRTPPARKLPIIAAEVREVLDLYESKGWLENPAAYHQAPEIPGEFTLHVEGFRKREFKVLGFPSPYTPHLDLPGGEEWRKKIRTGRVHARIFEHEGNERPWLMCIHGYRMGWPYMDFQLFSPGWLHHRLGFNLIMPLLPLHGPRKEGFRSGDGFFEGDLVQLLHAESQAVADIRACLYWLRENRPVNRLGVYGVSLGGLNACLLGALESEIDSLTAGIPLVDPTLVFFLNAKSRLIKSLERHGIAHDEVSMLLRPVSPLAMPCRVPVHARRIIAGSQDRILPLEPILALQKHWDDCSLNWFAGSHLSIRREHEVGQWLKEGWKAAGMLPDEGASREKMQAANAGGHSSG